MVLFHNKFYLTYRFKELYRFPIYLAVDLIEEIRQFYDDTVGEIPLHIKVIS